MDNYVEAVFPEDEKQETAEAPERVTRRPFAVWEVGGEAYRMKLTTSDIQELEQRYKTNLLNVLTTDDDTGMPALSVMLDIAQVAIRRYRHGITRAKVVELFDQYVEDGGSQFEFYTNVFTDIFMVSGFFSRARVAKMQAVQNDLSEEA